MSKYCLKKLSKRQGSKKKFKVVKKVREHHRKLKKETRKNGTGTRKPAEKMIPIPNKCPFKEELLLEAENKREQVKTEKDQKKEANKTGSVVLSDRAKMNTDIVFSAMNNDIRNPEAFPNVSNDNFIFEPKDLLLDKNDKSTRVFASEVRKMVDAADIIIEVLDARDPLGSRNRGIEKSVIQQGKRLILLVNKIDLVPKENVKKWLKYLRQELPAVAFKASTQEQANKLGRYNKAVLLEDMRGSKCIGADLIMSLLSNYCRSRDIKTSVKVGIVGYPNVGKSSVINSLKRRRACNTGAAPGVTRQLQEVELDKHIRLIDSPGVVLASKEQFDPVEAALKNAVRIETLDDPVAPITAILRRCAVNTLMLHFSIGRFMDADEFLSLIARKYGKLKKGGRPDIKAAAKIVLQAWTTGKLRYHTEPPESVSKSDAICSTELLTTFSKEFNLNEIDDDKLVQELPEDNVMTVDTLYDPSKPRTDTLETDIAMDDDEPANGKTVVTGKKERKVTFSNKVDKLMIPANLSITGNVQLNKVIQEAMKKNKKMKKKTAKRADKMQAEMEQMLSGGGDVEMEDYDFDALKNA